MKTKRTIWLVVVVMLAVVLNAGAALVTLEDNNSSVTIDPESDAGVMDWFADGTDNLFRQWFWYRVGDTAEAAIDTISQPQVLVTNADFDPGNETVNLRYMNRSLQIDVTFVLSGGTAGSGVSDLAEIVNITNIGDAALDMHFFQYVDFDMAGTMGSDLVELANANTFMQTEGGGNSWISETVVTPAPSGYEAGNWNAILSRLRDGVPDDLDGTSIAGPGDVEWAFQWDFVLAEGDSYIISKDKHMEAVPEPATMILLGLGSVLLRKRK